MTLRTAIVVSLCFASLGFADDADHLLRIDHYVQVRSTVPAISGQSTQIYVREVVEAGTVLRSGPSADRVALFIHGAGTPAEVSFDVPYQDYSWMAYLAHAGFDVFSMDMTGYGRSTRPAAMNDPCNLTREQQALYVPTLIPAPCAASYPHQMTTLGRIGTISTRW
jgi:pimeloyl-ACP methyl ester carboxylesterase